MMSVRVTHSPAGDLPSTWSLQQAVESGASQVTLPPRGWMELNVPTAELLHLDMFLAARSSPAGDPFSSLIGETPYPRVLLLGDRHNPNNDPWYRAAFGPWGGSGKWLMETLLDLPPKELSGLALANALEEDLPFLMDAIRPASVVALGRNAEAECERLGIQCGYVPHPQWYRRFRHARGAEYLGLICDQVEGWAPL